MSKHSMSTYVQVWVTDGDEEAATAELRKLAIERLGGEEGLACAEMNRVGDQLCGTYTREWEEKTIEEAIENPDPVDPVDVELGD